MRAMPRVLAGSGECRDSGPAGAPVTEIRGRRHARGIARMARSYGGGNGYSWDSIGTQRRARAIARCSTVESGSVANTCGGLAAESSQRSSPSAFR